MTIMILKCATPLGLIPMYTSITSMATTPVKIEWSIKGYHTNTTLSLFRIPLVLNSVANILKIGPQIKN